MVLISVLFIYFLMELLVKGLVFELYPYYFATPSDLLHGTTRTTLECVICCLMGGLTYNMLTIFWQKLHFYDSYTMLSMLEVALVSTGIGVLAVLTGEAGGLRFVGRSRRGEGG